MKERLVYPDICKAIAIFVVTWSHAAQVISGLTWTNFWGGGQIDIAFHMPLFMLISGWFVNPVKLRQTNIVSFGFSKFKRLIIPAFTWFFICYLVGLKMHPIVSYWYLKALFVCLCIILVSVKLIKNDVLCAIVSTILVLVCPYSDIVNINFMFPFIWAGYFLRKYLDQTANSQWFLLFSVLISILLLLFWTKDYSVYCNPFKVRSVNTSMVLIYLYRFAIGFFISASFICFVKRLDIKKGKEMLAKVGRYSLVIYLSSALFNGSLKSLLAYMDIHTNQYIILDLLSLLFSVLVVWLSLLLVKICGRNKYLSLFVLGE